MLIAATEGKGGRKMLVIGLQEENLKRLNDDRPILKDLGQIVPELAGWDLTVLGPEDLSRFLAAVGVEEPI